MHKGKALIQENREGSIQSSVFTSAHDWKAIRQRWIFLKITLMIHFPVNKPLLTTALEEMRGQVWAHMSLTAAPGALRGDGVPRVVPQGTPADLGHGTGRPKRSPFPSTTATNRDCVLLPFHKVSKGTKTQLFSPSHWHSPCESRSHHLSLC